MAGFDIRGPTIDNGTEHILSRPTNERRFLAHKDPQTRSAEPESSRASQWISASNEKKAMASAVRKLVNSSAVQSQDVALRVLFRGWHRMAEASVERREQLITMWATALQQYRDNLKRSAIGNWRRALATIDGDDNMDEDSVLQFKGIQMKLADMHYQKVVYNKTLNHMAYYQCIQSRLRMWENRASNRILSRCFGKWYDALLAARAQELFGIEAHIQRRRLSTALNGWRRRTQLSKVERKVLEIRKKNAQSHLLHKLLTIHANERAKDPFGPAAHHRPWNDGHQSKHNPLVNAAATARDHMLRTVLTTWRYQESPHKSLEILADNFRKKCLLKSALSTIISSYDLHCDLVNRADLYRRFAIVTYCLDIWAGHLRRKRENIRQTRIVNNAIRQRDRQQRNRLFAAWKKLSERNVQASRQSDEISRNHNYLTAHQCISQWQREYSTRKAQIESNPYATPVQLDVQHQQPDNLRRYALRKPKQIEKPTMASDDSEKKALRKRVVDAEREIAKLKLNALAAYNAKATPIEYDKNLEAMFSEWCKSKKKQGKIAAVTNFCHNMQNKVASIHKREEMALQAEQLHQIHLVKTSFSKWRLRLKAYDSLMAMSDNHHQFRSGKRTNDICLELLAKLKHKYYEQKEHAKAADMVRRHRLVSRTLGSWKASLDTLYQLEDNAICLNNRNLITDFWIKLCSLRYMGYESQDSEGQFCIEPGFETDLESNYDLETASRHYGRELEHAYDGCDEYDEYKEDEIGELVDLFGKWHNLSLDWYNVKSNAYNKRTGYARQRIKDRLSVDNQFDWDIIHEERLLQECIKSMRALAALSQETSKQKKNKEVRVRFKEDQPPSPINAGTNVHVSSIYDDIANESDSSSSDIDSGTEVENEADDESDSSLKGLDESRRERLRIIELVVIQKQRLRVCKEVFRIWILECRVKLHEKAKFTKIMKTAFGRMGEIGRLAIKARSVEANSARKNAVKDWWQKSYILQDKLGNSAVASNGTIARNCIMRWTSLLRTVPKIEEYDSMYMQAVAFRWESEMRKTLLAWMRASKDERIKVRLANRVGRADDEYNRQMVKSAERWSEANSVRRSLQVWQTRAVAEMMRRQMNMRFAITWSDSNIKRHVYNSMRYRFLALRGSGFIPAERSK